ncbi:TolB family protein [Kitasatospora sp. NPDC087861]|uniref:TolB family protein n=1 Tax=Kitasatospora sp. NPDC087861 TaxID=3364070 RepID=UPI003804C85D
MTRTRSVPRLLRAAGALAAAALAAATVATPAQADAPRGRTERVSVGLGQAQPDGHSQGAGLSADGRFAVLTSEAANLVPGDTNGKSDVFVRDLWTGRTERVNTGPNGTQAADGSYDAAISGNGRYVAFSSYATNLTPGANLGFEDVYVHDRWTGTTELVSTGHDPARTQEGRQSGHPSLSWDGRYVAYQSNRSDLAPGTVTWTGGNIYVTDRWTGETRVASIGADGTEANASSASPALSADGRYAVYSALVSHGDGPWAHHFEVYVRDLAAGTETLVSVGLPGTTTTGDSYDGQITADARWVYFSSTAENLVPGDTNNAQDVFRRDLWTGRTERVSVAPDGSQTAGSSDRPFVDALGTSVLFTSADGTLVPGDTNHVTDVFLRHLPLL